MLAERFAAEVHDMLARIEEEEFPVIGQAAEVVARSMMSGGILHIFGTGHSHLVAEEVLYRAGVLAPVDAILEPSLTGHTEVCKSEFAERLEGWGKVILDHRDIRPQDVLLVVSNSGRNAAPVEVAMEAKARGVPVIAITSLAYSRSVSSRHSSGKRLFEVADLVIDNKTPLGDALVHVEGTRAPMGPGSGIAGCFIVHCLLLQVVEKMMSAGHDPPVFLSGNLDGAREYNRPLLERYKGRIKAW
ncbi:MAG: SIS domain-containing protein [Bacillota bacterium]